MNSLTKIVLVLAIVGAINWGLVGFFNWNLVDAIFGGTVHLSSNWFSRVIYAIVGVCGLYLIAVFPRLKESVTQGTLTRRAEART
jgi:uncharacterized membrane protein YuzA (DUF378 family)